MPARSISPIYDLNRYGSACRCLLRIRENNGNPVLSDRDFLAAHQGRFPEWADRPGETDAGQLFALAMELGLATRIELLRSYDHVLERHRAGDSILVLTERAPQQRTDDPSLRRYTLLMVDMNIASFTAWCPYPTGQEDTFHNVSRECWDEWQSVAVVLQRTSSPALKAAAVGEPALAAV